MGYNETVKKNDKDLYILRWDKHQDTVSEKSKDDFCMNTYISIPQTEGDKSKRLKFTIQNLKD